ncbi:DUF58 domain-containing protein [Sulfurimonas sp. SWIR-19]|uniref:DUF58 domain-containing protein n=1 Tax=Sulfurimonas sp. SWIR-19 TaxID=2878390 RepID=UPI001CF3B972|nr:DUF58 domain-containing protein [Sulfurimonas sp. SWIR-19]UCM99365.1 DUF58 domain-containing protein [Sulfurimonas sp. SWIR-19]
MLKTLLESNKKLALILIKTQREVFSKIAGENISKKRGEGYDFQELREYETGDDIRHIDWIISAKTTKPYVKVFHQQKELNVVIVPFLCGSLHFGTRTLKKDLLTQICALLSYSCVKQNNPFESYICSDTLFLCTQKTKQLFGVRRLAEKVDSFDVLGKTLDYSYSTQALYRQIQRKSMLFLIGDFFDTHALNLMALSLKHEIVLIIVRDRFEENPAELGELNITDPALGMSAEISLNKNTLHSYRKKIVQNDEMLYKKLQTAGVRFVKIYTDEDPAEKIIALMEKA